MPWYNDLRPDKGDDKKKNYALLFPEMTRAEKARVFNPFHYVFTDEQVPVYAEAMREDYQGDLSNEAYFQRYWKKNQISDHFPIWTEIIIDSSDSFLREKLQLIKAH